MSGSGGVSIARSRGGESRFYNPPPMRKQQQLQQQQQQKMTTTTMQRREQRPPLISKGSTEKRTDHEDCATLLSSSSSSSSSANNGSKTNDDNSTNLDRFLAFTTPVVSAQYLPKTSIRGCRGQECGLECPPYFEMVDAIAESEGISINNVNFKALLGRGSFPLFPFSDPKRKL